MESIHFKQGLFTVNLELRPPITIVTGDTSSGKTLLWNWIKLQSKLPEHVKKCEHFMFVNYDNLDINISLIRGKFIIIDNADVFFTRHRHNIEAVRHSIRHNQYLILCRGEYNLGVSPNHYATVVERDKVFTLEYEFDVEGWY